MGTQQAIYTCRLCAASAQRCLGCVAAVGSGKTLLLRRLQAATGSNKPVAVFRADTMATIGTEFVRLVLPKGAFSKAVVAREVGGAMLPLWPQYFTECDALLFVVDASNPSAMAPAAMELWSLLDDPKLFGKPVCVALNKCDLPVTLSRGEVDALLRLPDLEKLHGSRLAVVQVSAVGGDGAGALLEWAAAAAAAVAAAAASAAPGQRAIRSGSAWSRVAPL